MTTYNLFRRKFGHEFYCAVPEDRVVPSFIKSDGWEFYGKIDTHARRPREWDMGEVEAAVRASGYYMFEVVRARRAA